MTTVYHTFARLRDPARWAADLKWFVLADWRLLSVGIVSHSILDALSANERELRS